MMTTLRTFSMLIFVWLSCQAAYGELIAHYKFDGDTDDETGDFNAEDFGSALPSGQPGFDGTGEAFTFGDGEPGGVVVPINVGADEYADLSVTMWVKVDESIVNSPGLYKAFGHDDGGWDRGFGLDNRQGEYRFAAFNGNGVTPSTGTPISSEWTFLAAVWDTEGLTSDDGLSGIGEPATVTFYAGGNSVNQALNNTMGQIDAVIGAVRPDNFAETWRGEIDDVRIYDHALSLQEINDLRFIGVPPVAGDANNDGTVDLDDYELIQANAFSPDPLGLPRLGDVNGDNFVDFADFRIWKANYEPAQAADAARNVPEPNSCSLFVLGLCVLMLKTRRRAATS